MLRPQSILPHTINTITSSHLLPSSFPSFLCPFPSFFFICSILIMEIQPNIDQVDFQIAITSFRDELITKLDYFNTVEIQLLRKFQCNINVPQSHSELVFYLRNMIQLIEEAFKDVESYFNDLQMTFLYDYFRKAQILMVNGFNFLSQALVIQIDLNEKDREDKAKSREMERMVMVQQRTVKGPVKTLKEQAKEIEHYDFAINYYENEEAKVAEELHRIQDNIMMSKGLVDKLHPSKAVKELQEIKERAEITLENTQKIFEETYQLKYLEFKTYLSKLQRPEDVTRIFCDNLKTTMREKFQIGMKKSVNALYHMKREDQMRKLQEQQAQTDDVEIVSSAVKVERKPTFTTKNGEKLHNLLVRERKLTEKLLMELQTTKKEVELLTNEKFRLQVICKGLQTQNVEFQSNYDILSKIYDEKREEVTALKKVLTENECIIDRLKAYEMRFLNSFTSVQAETQADDPRTFCDKEIQANMQDNEIIVILKKTNQKMGERIREKEIRIKQIEKKQVTEKKEKIGRLRISQVMPTQIISNINLSNLNLGRQPSINDFRSSQSQSSEKSITSSSNREDKILQNIPEEKLSLKSFSKNSKFARPSNFSIKRPSTLEKNEKSKVDFGVQVGETCDLKAFSCKSIKEDSEEHKIPHFQLELRQNYSSKEEKRPETIAHFRPVELLSQRVAQESRFLKKHLTSSKDRLYRKEISNETIREDSIFNVRFEAFADSEEAEQPTREDKERQREKERICGFERLNIQTQENKMTLQKRSAFSKQFLYNLKRREKSSQHDEKNKTCVGEFYKSRRDNDSFQTKHLICIDRLNFNKKDSKRSEKMSIHPKPSQRLITEKQNQRT